MVHRGNGRGAKILREGGLKLDAMESAVDPRVEWNQMYREVWRIERDFCTTQATTDWI